MFKAFCATTSLSCPLDANDELDEPPLDARLDLYTARDYLRPMAGGAVYAIICGSLFCLPIAVTAGPWGMMIAFGVACGLIAEISGMMALSALIHHQIFLHRMRKYGPQFYSSEVSLETPAAEAFELCLAATSELPKSKIIGMDEKKGTVMVSLKGNFWITVDRQVTIRVKSVDDGKSTISIDPSVKLTRFRRNLIRLIWGEKWYPLIFRSDVSWNRKIMASVVEYISSVPNWDHKHDPQELIDSAFKEKLNTEQPAEMSRRSDAA